MITPNFHDYAWVIVNSSGGKDSQTALAETVRVAIEQDYPMHRIVVSHQCLGNMEWKGTLDLVKEQARHYGLRVEVSSYRNKSGDTPSLLDYVRQRGKWPSSSARFCTSEFKRAPGGRTITKMAREHSGDVLNVYGFRASESPARAKKQVFVKNERFSNKSRTVMDWLPIHHWTDAEVWASIKASTVPYHRAYDLGMPRLSCVFCIFAPRPALIIAGKENPALLDEYVAVEKEISHTFRKDQSLAEIKQAVESGECVDGNIGGAWNM